MLFRGVFHRWTISHVFTLMLAGILRLSKELYAFRIIDEDEGLDVNAQDAEGMAALHYALMLELYKVVKALLADADIKPFLRNNQGHSALRLAQDNNLDRMIHLLLAHPLTLPVEASGKLATTWGHLKQGN